MAATILCIDDEVLLREDIVEELEDEGYRVLQACDGHEGLKQILQHHPDLVICDITMPRKNGYQLLKEVRGDHGISAEMPFIFLSALADKEHVVAGLRLGADNYITKPVDFDVLRAKVKTCLRLVDRIRTDVMTGSDGKVVLDC
ncbi:MAG TPA: response regulator [Rhizobiales bacterium]|nr:transcriptional regulatory protein AfsQ1 [bacterium BMS3Bbin10]HDO51763.1 response regulator [Hyphomicrobiales bacterium]